MNKLFFEFLVYNIKIYYNMGYFYIPYELNINQLSLFQERAKFAL